MVGTLSTQESAPSVNSVSADCIFQDSMNMNWSANEPLARDTFLVIPSKPSIQTAEETIEPPDEVPGWLKLGLVPHLEKQAAVLADVKDRLNAFDEYLKSRGLHGGPDLPIPQSRELLGSDG